jgi:polar amino acid transport system substrate-binding protein
MNPFDHTRPLRVGINFGNVLLTAKAETGDPRGVAPELARELGQRLNVPIDFVTYESAGRMANGAKSEEWDVAFLATDPARAEEITFTAPYLEVGTTYLVWSESTIENFADVDGPDVHISVSNKSAYDLFLTRTLKHAHLERAQTPGASIDLFFANRFEALAGLRPFLMDVAAKHAGTRLLEGSFMTVQQAIGVPKGHDANAAYLREFIEEVRTSGFVQRLLDKNGIRGASVASSPR